MSSFDQTKEMLDRIGEEQGVGPLPAYPHHAMSWGLCGLASSTTHPHRDSHGMPTHISPLCGEKLWTVFEHEEAEKDDCNFYNDYSHTHFKTTRDIQKHYRAETVLLDNTTHL